MIKVGGRNINGVDTEIHVDVQGTFYIVVDGKQIGNGTTLENAVGVARNAINRDKTVVAVAFITKTGGERGVATGFHSRNKTIMARIAGGPSEQLEYSYQAFKPLIPEAKVTRWFEIKDRLEVLRAEQRRIEDDYGITLRAEVQDAISKAQAEGQATQQEEEAAPKPKPKAKPLATRKPPAKPREMPRPGSIRLRRKS